MLEDPLLLARLQFALTAATHYMFVALTLGLAPYILVTQAVAAVRGDRSRMAAVRFWGGLYLVNYGMGVLSGLVMELQLGLNWSGLQEVFGYSFAAPIAVETMTAFFVESTFLGLWVFGWDRMGRWAHLACFAVVTTTAYASAWWVLVANGFLRHPVGFETVDGVAHLTDPAALLANPASALAFGHVVTGAALVGALVIAAVSAYHLMRRDDPHGIFRRGVRYAAITVTLLVLPVAAFGGTQFEYFGEAPPTSGLTYSAEEIAAIEATAEGGAAEVAGLAGETTMVLAWTLIALMGPLMLLAWPFGGLDRWRWFLAPLVAAPLLPYAASAGGWVFRETGRQPWVVVHHLTTADAMTPLSPGTALVSFSLFTGAFAVLASVTCWLLVRYARLGPDGGPLAERGETASEEPAAPVHPF
ncbi:cytochrome bd ubiquinol oxidase subunit I [Nocardiopsis sp. CNR-923]|uniref:cytochrome ubiquinol oxidase subunit I n=1 Tax=Nocardiopsis sp. CNR-923 TaxID=1904965 RepID=UPI000968E22F|nr:cytochrome ubiquinol oxidase subunit I [Nocardiopsis sp. CNR-923]OLT28231.1 cytochrome bd ubiquinol oxidase subunit I [Nocardiopsis sp. CNR-923]